MSGKRNRLRDSFTVGNVSTTKSANGDLIETVASELTFRCYVLSQDTVLAERPYEVPQIEFDYVLELRKETLVAASVTKGSRVTTSKTGVVVFEVISTITDTLRKAKIYLRATN
jgi:hypothetical protein